MLPAADLFPLLNGRRVSEVHSFSYSRQAMTSFVHAGPWQSLPAVTGVACAAGVRLVGGRRRERQPGPRGKPRWSRGREEWNRGRRLP